MPFADIATILVTYNTPVQDLEGSLKSLVSQSDVVIVDNSIIDLKSSAIEDISRVYGCIYIPLEGNLGLAEAQNIGIRSAFNLYSYNYIFLVDDDSIVPDGLLAKMSSLLYTFDNKIILSARLMSPLGINCSNTPISSAPFSVCTEL